MAGNIKKKHKKIIREASELDQEMFGYSHRRHKKNKEKTGKKRTMNFKKEKIQEIREREWQDFYNIFRNEY